MDLLLLLVIIFMVATVLWKVVASRKKGDADGLALTVSFRGGGLGDDPIVHFYTKVVGVTHQNDDGSKRQKIIKKECESGHQVTLERDPDNKYDPNAVTVSIRGQQIGFLSRDLAEVVSAKLQRGSHYTAIIKDITGGGRGESYGVNLLMICAKNITSNKEIQEYIKSEVNGFDL